MSEPTEQQIIKLTNEFNFYQLVGANIRDFRKKAGLTQDDLGYVLNISRVSVNNIELGKQRLPVHLISAIGNLFKAYMHEIIPFYDKGIKTMNDLYEHKKAIAIAKLDSQLIENDLKTKEK